MNVGELINRLLNYDSDVKVILVIDGPGMEQYICEEFQPELDRDDGVLMLTGEEDEMQRRG